MSSVYHLIGAYFSIIELAELKALPMENNPDIYEVQITLHFKDGGMEIMYPGFLINTVTGECTNKNNSSVVKTGFNFNTNNWKGNYLISNGGEVGMYNRQPGSFGTYYVIVRPTIR